MNLFEKIGVDVVRKLDELNLKKQIVAIHAELKGARVVLATAEMILLEGLDKDETTRLFMYLGFKGTGPGGIDTPAFAPHLQFCTQQAPETVGTASGGFAD